MANFGPKPWTNPFRTRSIFLTFSTFSFYSLQRYFFDLQYHKTHLTGLYCIKRKNEKWPIVEQNRGLTPLKKGPFFDFFNFLFLYSRKIFFCSRVSKITHFPGLYWLKKNSLKNVNFWTFSFFCFCTLESHFFRSRVSLNTFSCPILPKKRRLKNGRFWTKRMD